MADPVPAELPSALSLLRERLTKNAPEGGSFDRPRNLPPYLLRKGDHPIDKQMEAESRVEADAVALAKSGAGFGSLIGDGVPDFQGGPNALPSQDDVHTLFTMAGALFPPYDPEVLSSLQEHSNSLRPNVDAYKTNIDGFGYRLEPVIDPDDPDSAEKIGDALYLMRLRDAELAGQPAAPYPSDEEIEAYRK